MPKIQNTLTLTIDEQAYAVDKMSPQVQQLIAMFDEWRQKEVDAQGDLLLVRAALRDIQRELYDLVTKERAEAMKRAEAFTPVAEVEAANSGE